MKQSLRRAPRCAPRSSPNSPRLDDAGFRALFAKSAVKRIGRARFVRNVLIAIGNSGDRGTRRRGRTICSDDPSPLVRGAAVWALGRLDRARLAHCAERFRAAESDPDVIGEWAAAREG